MSTIEEAMAAFDSETKAGSDELLKVVSKTNEDLAEMAKRHDNEKFRLQSVQSQAVHRLRSYEFKRRDERDVFEHNLRNSAKIARAAKKLEKARKQEQPTVKLESLSTACERDRTGSRVAEIYVKWAERPLNQGDIVGDFGWRRTHEQPMSPEQVQIALEKLQLLGQGKENADKLKITYSRNCGCSSCPCSPGYVVSYANKEFRSYKGARDLTVLWLSIETVTTEAVQS